MVKNKISTPASIPTTATSQYNDFFEFFTIHGVKELKRSENSPSTIAFWIVVVLGCFAGVSYEIYQIVIYYQDNPGVTQVSWTTELAYKYPPMAFCPKTWLSWRRARPFNFSENALAYIASLVNMDILVDDDFDEDKIRSEVAHIMRSHNVTDFIDLLKLISYEPSEILRTISAPGNVTFAPILQSFGVCYLIDVEPILASTLRTNVMLRLAYKTPKGDARLHRYDGRWQSRLLLRDSNGLRANFISLGRKAIYIIDFEAEVHTRMSRSDKLCSLDQQIPSDIASTNRKEEYSAALCEFLCVEKERLERSCDHCLNIALISLMKLGPEDEMEPCFYYRHQAFAKASEIVDSPPESIEQLEHEGAAAIDSLLDSPQCSPQELKSVKEKCASTCPPPCTQWLFKYSTSILSEDTSSGEILLWVAYNPIDGVMLYEEVPTYTLDTFISNIGGLLGLWLGASIISIVQIFYYILALFWSRRAQTRKLPLDLSRCEVNTTIISK